MMKTSTAVMYLVQACQPVLDLPEGASHNALLSTVRSGWNASLGRVS
jgi:hypothetical protein